MPGGSANATLAITLDPDTDGDGVRDGLDADDDNDGIPDLAEGSADPDGDGIPASKDLDSDGDGIPDVVEAQATASYIVPGGAVDGSGKLTVFGGGLVPVDTDSDGTPDFLDTNSDGVGGGDTAEAGLALGAFNDADGDGLDDDVDTDDRGLRPGACRDHRHRGRLSILRRGSQWRDPNEAPAIANNGSAATHALNYPENDTDPVDDYNASDINGETEGAGLVWSISGGADAAAFAIDRIPARSLSSARRTLRPKTPMSCRSR
ncbi:MAG: hypothetical protein R3F11_27105 [Verrucomicrobiales bacterium]